MEIKEFIGYENIGIFFRCLSLIFNSQKKKKKKRLEMDING